jgi:hypothetical protein
MALLGAGLTKLVVTGTIAVSGVIAGYNAIKPSAPMTPAQRQEQGAQMHKANEQAGERRRRGALRRGIDADNRRRNGSTGELIKRGDGSLVGRVLRHLPKPRRLR